jgi:hypothetical protein
MMALSRIMFLNFGNPSKYYTYSINCLIKETKPLNFKIILGKQFPKKFQIVFQKFVKDLNLGQFMCSG